MTTVGDRLKFTIEAWVDDFRLTVLKELAQRSTLPPRFLARYLESLRYLFVHSERSLIIAAQRSRELGRDELAAYFAGKAHEEDGHATWAEDDLAHLPVAAREDVTPAPAIIELVRLQRTLIAKDPMCFAAYALWAEYMTVLLGDEWLAILSACGYRPTQVSAVSKHLEADREHAAHAFEELSRLWTGLPSMGVLEDAIKQAGQTFEQFSCELMSEVRSAA
jgi:hypothetical protein